MTAGNMAAISRNSGFFFTIIYYHWSTPLNSNVTETYNDELFLFHFLQVTLCLFGFLSLFTLITDLCASTFIFLS